MECILKKQDIKKYYESIYNISTIYYNIEELITMPNLYLTIFKDWLNTINKELDIYKLFEKNVNKIMIFIYDITDNYIRIIKKKKIITMINLFFTVNTNIIIYSKKNEEYDITYKYSYKYIVDKIIDYIQLNYYMKIKKICIKNNLFFQEIINLAIILLSSIIYYLL